MNGRPTQDWWHDEILLRMKRSKAPQQTKELGYGSRSRSHGPPRVNNILIAICRGVTAHEDELASYKKGTINNAFWILPSALTEHRREKTRL